MSARIAPVLALFLTFCLPVFNAGAAQYAVTDLGTLDGMRSWATGINDLGQVVGNLYDPSTDSYLAFFWQDGAMTVLTHPEGSESKAADINNAGQIVGEISGAGVTGNYQEACLWHDGSLTHLGTLPWQGRDDERLESWATCINEAGQIAGSADTGTGRPRGFLWQDGVMIDLDPVGITSDEDGFLSEPQDINAGGQIVGWRYLGLGWWDAYIWEDGITTPLDGVSFAYAINDAGQIVAGHRDLGAIVVGRDGIVECVLTGLAGSRGITPSDIDSSGRVVGICHTSDGDAFIWQHGAMSNLNDLIPSDSGWALYGATAINERGQIVGHGRIDGEFHAFLLTPVPEPSALAIVALGLLAAVLVRRGS